QEAGILRGARRVRPRRTQSWVRLVGLRVEATGHRYAPGLGLVRRGARAFGRGASHVPHPIKKLTEAANFGRENCVGPTRQLTQPVRRPVSRIVTTHGGGQSFVWRTASEW